jgi:aspartate oxidase
MNYTHARTDFLVIGGGISGLSLALKLAVRGQVTVVVKNRLEESNTWYAQGGIASVLDPSDSIENHVRDTMTAGAGLCWSRVRQGWFRFVLARKGGWAQPPQGYQVKGYHWSGCG